MHPALSVLLLTTLIGAGQGLFIALVTLQALAAAGLLPAGDDRALYVAGSALALALLVAGLVASFFHLGRPERAWRSAAQWRTSWLAREVIVLPALMGVVALYGLLHFTGASPVLVSAGETLAIDLALAVGFAGALLALALFVCTGMIYACLRFLAEWHTPLTPLNYTLMGSASGLTLAAALAAALAPQRADPFAAWAIAATALAAAGRIASLVRNARLKPRSTLQTAIGVKHPTVVQRSMGFMGGSFNTREFFHGAGRSWLRAAKPGFIVLAFVLPLMLLVAARAQRAGDVPAVLAATFVLQYLGLLAERWYFFAEARHPQNLYYQAVA
jgi:DMSO reductase anchor subunit